MKIITSLICVLLVVTVIGAIDGRGDGDDGSNGRSLDQSSLSPDNNQHGLCGFVATSTCSPDLGAGEMVSVGGLRWRARSMTRSERVGGGSFASGLEAKGVYVRVGLSVESRRRRAVALDEDVVQLVGPAQTVYSADLAASALVDTHAEDVTLTSRLEPRAIVELDLAFDVPATEHLRRMRIRFNEPGSGTNHAYLNPLVRDRRLPTGPARGKPDMYSGG